MYFLWDYTHTIHTPYTHMVPNGGFMKNTLVSKETMVVLVQFLEEPRLFLVRSTAQCRSELLMEQLSLVGLAELTVTNIQIYSCWGKSLLNQPCIILPQLSEPLCTYNKAYTPHTLCLLFWYCSVIFGDTCIAS